MESQISLIVAAAENGAIGKDGELPWRLPDDLKFFKKNTLGKPMIMGRKTWESLGGKALPGRTSIVLSRKEKLELPEEVKQYTDLQDAIASVETLPEIMIIGGGQIFKEAILIADVIYHTLVHTVIEDADAFFPDIDTKIWEKTWEEAHAADERHPLAFTFQLWKRRA